MLDHIKPNSLVIMDVDGTLITSPKNDQYKKWEPLMSCKEIIDELIFKGHKIALVSNQAYVAFGHATETDVHAKFNEVISYYNLPKDTPWRACYHHPMSSNPLYNDPHLAARRKPSPIMLEEIMILYPDTQAYYVGDSPEDQSAALAAKIPFIWAQDFFSPL